MAGIAQHHEKTLQETQCSEVVDVTLHPGRPLALALTFGWPASQASRPSAIAVSFDARPAGTRAESQRTPALVW